MLSVVLCVFFFFFFKQKTAYEMRISDWSSDVCSSDLPADERRQGGADRLLGQRRAGDRQPRLSVGRGPAPSPRARRFRARLVSAGRRAPDGGDRRRRRPALDAEEGQGTDARHPRRGRSEEHTSELQSLMRISYAVFCL